MARGVPENRIILWVRIKKMPAPATWKTPEVIAKVRQFCATEVRCGNAAIARLLLHEFGLRLRPGQIAGMMTREGIVRGFCGREGGADPDVARVMAIRAGEIPWRVRAAAGDANPASIVDMKRATDPAIDPAVQAEHDRRMAQPVITARPPIITSRSGLTDEQRAYLAERLADCVTPVARPPIEKTGVPFKLTRIERSAAQLTRLQVTAKATANATKEATLAPLPALVPPITAPSPFSDRVYRPVRKEEPVARYGRVTECAWPIGEPGARDFRYCDDPSSPGKSYCEDHCAVAYSGFGAVRAPGAAHARSAHILDDA